jgi:superfamily II DNA or RNA helicase
VKDFNAGKINCLVATEGKLSEGTDIQRVNVLVLANFAASKGLVLQCVGRGLRIYEGKDHCMILDYKLINNKMLSRHADLRIGFYREITDKVKVIS